MSDIVERLLDYPKFLTAIPPDTLMREAASTITALEERVVELERLLELVLIHPTNSEAKRLASLALGEKK